LLISYQTLKVRLQADARHKISQFRSPKLHFQEVRSMECQLNSGDAGDIWNIDLPEPGGRA